jgi:biopolymer transport protein ExbB
MENEATAVVENPYGLQALWMQGDVVARGTLILLVLMSFFSWYIILTKLWDQRRLKKAAKQVEKQFWTAPSLKDGVERLKKGDDFRNIAEDGLRSASHHDGRLTDRIDLHEWITMSLQRSVDEVNSKLQSGMPFLATVGSTAPFVGLFGTVWGIMSSFTAIARSNDTSLAVVAPGIAEALFATAIGLVAAIPAVVAYNKLTTARGRDAQRLNAAAATIGGRLARHPPQQAHGRAVV